MKNKIFSNKTNLISPDRVNKFIHFIKFPIRFYQFYFSRKNQLLKFEAEAFGKADRIIIFLIPSIYRVTGGVLQIFTHKRLTDKIFQGTDTRSAICWIPNQGWYRDKYSEFENNEVIFSLSLLLKLCNKNSKILIHLPEYQASNIVKDLIDSKFAKMLLDKEVTLNILNQNIEVMPSIESTLEIKHTFPNLTCTLGNPIWLEQIDIEKYKIPFSVLPIWYYPDDAPWQIYESKKDIFIISPDKSVYRDEVIKKLETCLPNTKIIVIKNLKYEEYLQLERVAKWSLTFGEGFDGYFYSPFLRGGVSFAVRNDTFDLIDDVELETVFESYDNLADKILSKMNELDNKEKFEHYSKSVRTSVLKHMSKDKTYNALESYYKQHFRDD